MSDVVEAGKSKSSLRKNLITVLLLAFAGSIIYGLPYYRYYYYDTYMELYDLTNVQMGLLGSAYGLLGMISYILGGVLADKYSAKLLIVFSLVATGSCGFLHLLTTDFHVLLGIYVIWGLTSLLTFWPACVKMVRMQGNDSEQSRTYGIFEGVRGAFNAIHLAVATIIFGIFEAKAMPMMGVRGGILFYSMAPIVTGVILAFLLKNPNKQAAEQAGAGSAKAFSWKEALKVMKMPSVWLIVVLVFTSYTFNMSVSYFNPYATELLGATAVVAAIITTSSQYIRPISGLIGGFLGDRFGKSTFIIIGYILMIIGILGVISAGKMGSAGMAVVAGSCIVMYFGMYFCFCLTFSFLSEGGVPVELSGVASGLVCTIGYLPEVIDPLIAGKILDTYEGIKGYHIYFYFMMAMAVIGLGVAIYWDRTYGKRFKEAQAREKAAAAAEASGEAGASGEGAA